jgi:hypothetical protein
MALRKLTAELFGVLKIKKFLSLMILNLELDHGSPKQKFLLIKQLKSVFAIAVLVDVLSLLPQVFQWQLLLTLEIKLEMKI